MIPSQTIAAGSYATDNILQAADCDLLRSYEMTDELTNCQEAPSDLTGRLFFFEIKQADGTVLATLEIGSGITVAGNVVTVSVLAADWDEWPKNCDLKYRFWQVLVGGRSVPLFNGKLKLKQ